MAAMAGLAATLMSIAVIAALALAGGGAWLLAKGRERERGALMLLAALVTLANVLIWTL
jgi:hypothetical protein